MCTCRENSRKKREFQKNFCFIGYARAFDWVDHNKLWKILQEMGIPDNLTCLLRNLCRSSSNSYNWTWNNRLVPNRERYADDITLMAESEELKSLLTSKITMIFISSYQKSNWCHFQNHKVQVNSSAHRRHCV